jgi:hypothetical protein
VVCLNFQHAVEFFNILSDAEGLRAFQSFHGTIVEFFNNTVIHEGDSLGSNA